MDLVGASSITIINLIMPAVMYLLVMKNAGQVAHKNTVQLNSQNDKFISFRKIGWAEKCYCYFLITFGALGATTSTYTAVKNMLVTRFQLPCYLS